MQNKWRHEWRQQVRSVRVSNAVLEIVIFDQQF